MPSYKVRMLRERIEYVDLYIDSAEDEEEAGGDGPGPGLFLWGRLGT